MTKAGLPTVGSGTVTRHPRGIYPLALIAMSERFFTWDWYGPLIGTYFLQLIQPGKVDAVMGHRWVKAFVEAVCAARAAGARRVGVSAKVLLRALTSSITGAAAVRHSDVTLKTVTRG